MALPELDGGIEPIVFAGRDSNTGKSHSLPDRIDALCRCGVGGGRLGRLGRLGLVCASGWPSLLQDAKPHRLPSPPRAPLTPTSPPPPPPPPPRSRAINWANLARKEKKDKKLAITVFSFPPDKGNVGTAAYLNVSAAAGGPASRVALCVWFGWEWLAPGSAPSCRGRVGPMHAGAVVQLRPGRPRAPAARSHV